MGMRSPKIRKRGGFNIFYKNRVWKWGLDKKVVLSKEGDAWHFYCLEYKADIATLELSAKLELIDRMFDLLVSLSFPDYYPCSVMLVLQESQ